MEIKGSPAIPVVRPQNAWPKVHAFCTTREGGVGIAPYDTFNLGLGAGEAPKAVLANRQLLRAMLPAEPAWLKQVHGVRVVDADDPTIFACDQTPPEADASVTSCPERVLAVLTADCLSVVLSDKEGAVLGVAHAGWKGLAAGVLEEALALMHRKQPQSTGWRAWIGPGIGADAFQVGAEVLHAFAAELAEQPSLCVEDTLVAHRWRLDLAGLAQWRLLKMGVRDVERSHACTVTQSKNFFSYRRDRQTGRMATVAWIGSGKT